MSRQQGLVRNEPQQLVQADQLSIVAPACDVYENADELLVAADLPGVASDALDISFEKGELTIVARRQTLPQRAAFLGSEFRDCEFRRRFAVPAGIDASKIKAEIRSGVLMLHLPKSDALKPRQIAVQAG
jgi:HSP20 family molecular chaperone IbpA